MSSDINVQTFSGKVNITSNLLVGNSHLFVDTTNNRVGLVTVNPDAGLHVNSNAYVDTDFRVGPSIVMNETSGQITAGSFVGDGSGITSVNSDSGSWVNGTDTVYLSTIGDKVGIGVNPPLYKLDVDGDINFTGALKYQGSDYVSTPWTIHTSPDALSYTAGNIGIGGAASATNRLKVHGTVEATGFTGIQVGDVPTLNQNTTGSAGSATTAGTITSQANSATITASASAGNSTIVQRHSSGYIFSNYINTTDNAVTSGVVSLMCKQSNDYHRSASVGAVRTFLGLGAYAYKGDSSYNIHDGWLRESGDNDFVKLYGNSRSMVFRTDGTTQYSSNGGYPFVWLYGGDATGNRRMMINTSGQLWMSNYGWLHDKFADKGGSTGQNFYTSTIYVGGSTSKGLRSVSGNYGTVQTTGGGSGGWEGYSIDGRYVFMSSDNNSCGIYNDIDNEWMIYCYRNDWVKLYYNGSERFITTSYGNSIQGGGLRIHVFETTTNYTNSASDWWTNGGSIQVDPPNLNFSLYCAGAIRAPQYVAFSDVRIKKDITEIDDTSALESLRKLNPTTYNYIDKTKTTNGKVIGFIAQEVAEVLPNAVTKAHGVLPNIQCEASVEILSDTEIKLVLVEPLPNNHTVRPGSKLIIKIPKHENIEFEVVSLENDTTIIVKDKDGYDKIKTETRVWVFGEEINDFHHLDKNAIFTIATAALQEVDRQQQSDKVRITTLETQLQAEKTKTYELQQKVELLEMSHGALVERIEALEKL